MAALNTRTAAFHKIMGVICSNFIFNKEWDKPKRDAYFEWLNQRQYHRIAFLTFAESEGFIRLNEIYPRIHATKPSARYPFPWSSQRLKEGGNWSILSANGKLVAENLTGQMVGECYRRANTAR